MMEKFINLCKIVMESAFDFEAVQSYCALFLKLHADTILQNDDLSDALTKLQFTQDESWHMLKIDDRRFSGGLLIYDDDLAFVSSDRQPLMTSVRSYFDTWMS